MKLWTTVQCLVYLTHSKDRQEDATITLHELTSSAETTSNKMTHTYKQQLHMLPLHKQFLILSQPFHAEHTNLSQKPGHAL